MCGIVCAFELKQPSEELRPQLLEMSKQLRHRGPDWSGIFADSSAILAHERLAIVDPASGKQPLYSPDGDIVLAANGEIYNHRKLRTDITGYHYLTGSDCEVIIPLYREFGHKFLDDLNGIFAFALYDARNNNYLIARDHMGIIPLYIGWDSFGTLYVASELKALEGVCKRIEVFPPGHYMTRDSDGPVKWYRRDWEKYDSVKDNDTDIEQIHDALEAAVVRQLMSDVPYGVLYTIITSQHHATHELLLHLYSLLVRQAL